MSPGPEQAPVAEAEPQNLLVKQPLKLPPKSAADTTHTLLLPPRGPLPVSLLTFRVSTERRAQMICYEAEPWATQPSLSLVPLGKSAERVQAHTTGWGVVQVTQTPRM